MALNLRNDFPALMSSNVAFLDSGASAQKPQAVLDAMNGVLAGPYANIHRGLYEFSQKTTSAFENARAKVASFIGAAENEVIFVRNTTEGINLVASCCDFNAGDEIILTEMEHHANLVPWHLLRDRIGVKIKYIPVNDDGTLNIDTLDTLLTDKTKFISFTHISNALGTINPVKDITARIKKYNDNIKIMIDGSQSAVHMKIDVNDLGCDFFVFTGHKLYGPNGIGVLWGKYDVLDAMPPYQGGGDMIERVTLDGSTYAAVPGRFEAGTPAIAEAIGLGAAVDYIENIGWNAITDHEGALSATLYDAIANREDCKIIGDTKQRAGIVSFTMNGAHHSDVAMVLDQCGVAVRTGHHCCMPLMDRFGIDGTIRASLAIYSTMDDINALMTGLDKARKLLS